MKRSEAVGIRKALDNLVATIPLADEVAFNGSAGVINENYMAFRVWLADVDYVRGDVRVDPADGVPYWAMHDNGKTSGQVHQPSVSPTVWVHCHGTTMETARPFIAEGHNPYMTGHYCTENGGIFRCKRDNVVHAPSVLLDAWEKVAA